jgi:hypothetical protein
MRLQRTLGGELERLRKNVAEAIGLPAYSTAVYTPPSSFRIYAWRWHHIALERDLGRIKSSFFLHKRNVCAPNSVARLYRERLANAFAFVIKSNWLVHDWVEEKLFVPFVLSVCGQDCPSQHVLHRISRERTQLASARQRLRDRIDRWVAEHYKEEESCEREAERLSSAVSALRAQAQSAFNTSERALVPVVAKCASREKQESFNKSVVGKLDGGRARLALVLFSEAILGAFQDYDSRATKQDIADFDSSIPKAVRMLIPVWRRNLVRKNMSVIDELGALDVCLSGDLESSNKLSDMCQIDKE